MDDQQEIIDQIAAIDAELSRLNTEPEAVVSDMIADIEKRLPTVSKGNYGGNMQSMFTALTSRLAGLRADNGAAHLAAERERLLQLRYDLEGRL